LLKKKVILYFGFIIFLTAGGGILFYFNPTKESFFPPCPVYATTHLYCPGCGSLRAFHALLHGHIIVALHLNPLMVFFLPILIWMVFRPKWLMNPKGPWIILFILVGYMILRNLPFWPFYYLAPH